MAHQVVAVTYFHDRLALSYFFDLRHFFLGRRLIGFLTLRHDANSVGSDDFWPFSFNNASSQTHYLWTTTSQPLRLNFKTQGRFSGYNDYLLGNKRQNINVPLVVASLRSASTFSVFLPLNTQILLLFGHPENSEPSKLARAVVLRNGISHICVYC